MVQAAIVLALRQDATRNADTHNSEQRQHKGVGAGGPRGKHDSHRGYKPTDKGADPVEPTTKHKKSEDWKSGALLVD